MFFIVGHSTQSKQWKIKEQILIAEKRFVTLFFVIKIPVITTWRIVSPDGSSQYISSNEVKMNFGIDYDYAGSEISDADLKVLNKKASQKEEIDDRLVGDFQESKPEKKSSGVSKIWNFIKNFFAITFFLLAFAMIRNSLNASIAFVLAGLITLPSFNDFVKRKLDFTIPRAARWILVPGLLFSVLFLIDTNKEIDGTKINKAKSAQEKAEQLNYIQKKYSDLATLKTKLDAEKSKLTEKPCPEALHGKELSKVDAEYLARFQELANEQSTAKESEELKKWHWLTDYKIIELDPFAEIKKDNSEIDIAHNYGILKTLYSNKYLLVFLNESRNLPIVEDKGFISGEFDGWIAVTDLEDKKVICAKKIQVENSSSVSVWSKGFVTKSKKEDTLLDNFQKNFRGKLASGTKELNISLYCAIGDIFCFKPVSK